MYFCGGITEVAVFAVSAVLTFAKFLKARGDGSIAGGGYCLETPFKYMVLGSLTKIVTG